jgi:hypothetical protein
MPIDLSTPLPKPQRRTPAKHWQSASGPETLCNSKAQTPVIADIPANVTCKSCRASAGMPEGFRQIRSYRKRKDTGRSVWVPAGELVPLIEALLTADQKTIDRVARVLRRAVKQSTNPSKPK